MNAPRTVAEVRDQLVAARGKRKRRVVAAEMGVNRHWYIKFELGVCANPTASNLLAVLAWLQRQPVSGSAGDPARAG